MKTIYTAHATSVGGRAGHVETDDKRLAFDLTPSNSKTGTNPEQLFACGYAACFGSALDAVAKKDNIDIGKVTLSIDVDLQQDEKGGFSLAATINVSLPGLDKATAEQLVNKAHHVCPYSKATRGNIPVNLKVNDQPLAQAA
jgi:osmotically inducible protein OsmC